MAVSKNFVVKNGLEVGGDTLFANSVTDRVGIGTTNPTSNFTVKGNTSLEDLTVSGVATFSNNVAIGTSIPISTLTVAGSGTSTAQLFVSGVSTFHNNAFIASDNRLYFGAETLSISFQSTPSVSNYIETFDHVPLNIVTENLTVGASDGETYANFKINSSVSLFYDDSKKFETSGLGVTVTGVTSTTYLYATGISTFITGPVFIGSGTTTGTAEQKLQVTGGGYFSSPVGIGITNPSNTLTVVGSGTSTAQLYVTGFSTFVGYSTFLDYVNIEDGLYVAGVSTFVGYSTFRDYVNIEDGLNVLGVSTFIGRSLFKNSSSGGTIIEDGNIYNTTGFSTFSINVARGVDFPYQSSGIGKLRISGDTGFGRGLLGFYDGSDNLKAAWDSNLSSGSIDIYNYTNSGTQNITISAGSSVVLQHGGTNTKLETLGTGITVTGTTFTNQLSVSGVSTFAGSTTVTGSTLFTNQLNVSGVSTLIGSVGIGTTNPTSNLTVEGNTSISGITTSSGGFIGNLIGNVTGDLNSSGVNTATTISGTNLTYNTANLTIGNIVSGIVTTLIGTDFNYSGIGTATTLNSTTGTITNLSGTNSNFSGVTTSTTLNVGTGGTVITTTESGSVGVGTINPVSKLSVVGGDASVGIDTSQGVILTASNGTRYRLFVENDGTLKTFAV